jgi:hypothetical protein
MMLPARFISVSFVGTNTSFATASPATVIRPTEAGRRHLNTELTKRLSLKLLRSAAMITIIIIDGVMRPRVAIKAPGIEATVNPT